MTYPIADIFRSIQGEGHFVGYPMTFVRLAGCSVADCHIRSECDEAPWRAQFKATTGEVIDRVRAIRPSGIVCITGGEPTDHDALSLVAALRDAGYRVHLETSGVRSVAGWPLEWLTVSPKRMDYVQRTGHTLKLVMRPEWTADPDRAWEFVGSFDVDNNFFHRYMQPLTMRGVAANLPEVAALVRDGYRNADGRWALSTQAHRVWGLR